MESGLDRGFPWMHDLNHVPSVASWHHSTRWMSKRSNLHLDSWHQLLFGCQSRPNRSIHHLRISSHGLHAPQLLFDLPFQLEEFQDGLHNRSVFRHPRFHPGKHTPVSNNPLISNRTASSWRDWTTFSSVTLDSPPWLSLITIQTTSTTQAMWAHASFSSLRPERRSGTDYHGCASSLCATNGSC